MLHFVENYLQFLGIIFASLLYSISFDFDNKIFKSGIGSNIGLIQICIFSSFFFVLSMFLFLLSQRQILKKFSNDKNNILTFLKFLFLKKTRINEEVTFFTFYKWSC